MNFVSISDVQYFLSQKEEYFNRKGNVAKACAVIEAYLQGYGGNQRQFLEQVLPVLISQVFDQSEDAGWLSTTQTNGGRRDCKALVELLGADGPLFPLLVNSASSINYHIPVTHLPPHTQQNLISQGEAGRQMPQYILGLDEMDYQVNNVFHTPISGLGTSKTDAGSIFQRSQGRIGSAQTEFFSWGNARVTPFRYFLFWLAQFAGQTEETRRVEQGAIRSALRAIQHVTQYVTEFGWASNRLYSQILQSYLLLLLPFRNNELVQKVPMNANVREDCCTLMVNTLVEHWLTDANEPPVFSSGKSRHSHANFFPPQSLSSNLSEALQVFFSHVLKGMEVMNGQFDLPEVQIYLGRTQFSSSGQLSNGLHRAPSWLQNFGSNSMQLINKRLYRKIRRALCACIQNGQAVAHRPVLQLYCTFVAPWKNLVEYNEDDDSSCYTPFWRKHVCANLPFYLILLPMFMHILKVRMVPQLCAEMKEDLELLVDTFSDELLLDELRMLERELRKCQKGELFCSGDEQLRELVPWAVRQCGIWERAAVSDENGDFGSKDIMLHFSCFEERMDNGVQLGCVNIARFIFQRLHQLAELELANKLQRLFKIDGNQTNWEICGNENKPPPNTDLRRRKAQRSNRSPQSDEDASQFLIRPGSPVKIIPYDGTQPSLRQGYIGSDPRFRNVKTVQYMGDQLLRPISSFEIGFLVHPLVKLSVWMNMWLDLDREFDSQEEVSDSWMDQFFNFLRNKDIRISFRVLADKRLWFWIFALYVLWYLLAMVLF